MQIEAKALEKIKDLEPVLRRTADGNKGFDLFEADGVGNVTRWVEVKSMTGGIAQSVYPVPNLILHCRSERLFGSTLLNTLKAKPHVS